MMDFEIAHKCCKSCGQAFPATSKHFYVKSRSAAGAPLLDYVCRACRVALNTATDRRRKAERAAGLMGPPKPERPPITVKKPAEKKPRRLAQLPRGLAMLSAWRGPVPAGYGARA